MIRVGIGGWGIRAVARRVLSEGAAAGTGAPTPAASTTIEINGTFYSTQKPESFRKWASETPMISCSRSRRRAMPPTAACWPRRRLDRAVLRKRRARAESEARADPLAVPSGQEIRCGRFRSISRTAAARACRQGDPPRRRGPPRELLACVRRADAQVLGGDRAGGVRQASADRRCHRRLLYLRLQRTSEKAKTGHRPRRSPPGRTARGLGRRRRPTISPTIAATAPARQQRDVFVYMIAGAKVRAPAAAMALIDELCEMRWPRVMPREGRRWRLPDDPVSAAPGAPAIYRSHDPIYARGRKICAGPMTTPFPTGDLPSGAPLLPVPSRRRRSSAMCRRRSLAGGPVARGAGRCARHRRRAAGAAQDARAAAGTGCTCVAQPASPR